jgi:hypothetical protein
MNDFEMFPVAPVITGITFVFNSIIIIIIIIITKCPVYEPGSEPVPKTHHVTAF